MAEAREKKDKKNGTVRQSAFNVKNSFSFLCEKLTRSDCSVIQTTSLWWRTIKSNFHYKKNEAINQINIQYKL